MHPWAPIRPLDFLNFKLVRVFFTKALLANVINQDVPVGDPGILFSDVVIQSPQ